MGAESGWDFDTRTNSYRPPVGVQGHSHAATDLPSAGATPIGGVIAFYGTTAPTNWLICNGSAFSSATYPALAIVLGGTTLPNLKGKVIVGVDAADVDFDVLGETGGAKTVTITSSTMPSHTHVQDAHDHNTIDHNHGGTGVESTNHSHQILWKVAENTSAADVQGWPANNVHTSLRTSDHAEFGSYRSTDGVSNNHTHTVGFDSVDVLNATPTNQSTGSDGAHVNVQPYVALSYIIRAA